MRIFGKTKCQELLDSIIVFGSNVYSQIYSSIAYEREVIQDASKGGSNNS
jgi:hypothetical protein